ncbi:nitrogen fixation protein NifT [Paraburkholderia sp. RAU2J]|uniref:putative nitrogen fixation protein NifT n=1 Tax=Paraburkholderia sp. RAU2J TaxID=1938810 RepID=UPI000EB1C150|nr:putative nitrogen fixation protein NifT [Paraburkholderia sp. RAU2J]RKT10388.1 nitrogen fixation protein NifT [Paraburkholderia sp. RAU2J]
MKLMIRKDRKGILSAYVTKKNLDEPIVCIAQAQMWSGLITLAIGWRFQLPEMAADTTLPVTVEAWRVAGGHD